MHLYDSKTLGAAVVGAVTLGLGYNIGATSWGVLWAVALMVLYWLIFQRVEPESGAESQFQRTNGVRSAQATRDQKSPMRASPAAEGRPKRGDIDRHAA